MFAYLSGLQKLQSENAHTPVFIAHGDSDDLIPLATVVPIAQYLRNEVGTSVHTIAQVSF